MSQAPQLLAELEARGLHLALAESLTGGLLGAELTAPAGASKVILGSIVAYQTSLKNELLGVSKSLLSERGAVDSQVAAQMAMGVRTQLAKRCNLTEAEVIGLSTTGVAGPDLQDGQAVGTVFVGLSGKGFEDKVLALSLSGDRNQIRQLTVDAAIEMIWEQIRSLPR